MSILIDERSTKIKDSVWQNKITVNWSYNIQYLKNGIHLISPMYKVRLYEAPSEIRSTLFDK